jgi:uncharacterized membrane protein
LEIRLSERAYRQRLEADIARWQAGGVITPTTAAAMRAALPPVVEGVNVATVVGIVGGLLIGAAALAFIAANWTAIERPYRFAILLAGIAIAYCLGALFNRSGRTVLSDLSAGVGTIVFGAGIALTGQMYHLSGDFAAGLLLLAGGALAAAVLTSSRGALAVALVAACVWNFMQVIELKTVHLPFVGFWLIAAVLAVVWNAPTARHLVALAALEWLVSTGFALDQSHYAEPVFAIVTGISLLLGAGLFMASNGRQTLGAFGLTLSHYGALALAISLAGLIAVASGYPRTGIPVPLLALGAAAVVLPVLAAVVQLRLGPMMAGIAIALALAMVSGRVEAAAANDSWLRYSLALGSMLCLVISGMLDEVRPRVVAGWIGLGLGIAAITWVVPGTILDRAIFLGAAGLIAIVIATLLGRLLHKEPVS